MILSFANNASMSCKNNMWDKKKEVWLPNEITLQKRPHDTESTDICHSMVFNNEQS